ncbi:MAG: bacillaene synthase trans-acting acyltransferase [Bradyrhizobium sp.]|jgi:acyl transferase domain-containing protein|nr:bacillaene synthase trans-acting acyltransferase [Bradyrhizobium sp.]
MSKRRVVFMFSGQGSQYYQMGRAFFDGDPAFRSIMLQLNDVAAPLLGRSIIDVLYNDGRRNDESFDEIQFTSAAIFIVEYALARVLINTGVKPDCLLSSSMGIYAAAAIAAALDPHEALECVIKLAAAYEARCPKGGMIAILDSSKLHSDLSVLRENSEIAAVNFDSHFVVSTIDEHLPEIFAALDRQSVAFQRIAVSYPFHSHWIDAARDAALAILGELHYSQPRIPLVCCTGNGVLKAVAPESIWTALRRPIEFERTIAELEQGGPGEYIDVGPSSTLATFLKYVLPSTSSSRLFSIMSPLGTDLKNYARLTAERNLFGGAFSNATQ